MLKKVLFISHDSALQGAELCLLDLVTRLDRSRFEPLVLLPWKGPLAAHLQKAGIPFVIRHVSRWTPSKRQANFRYPFTWFYQLRARLWSLLHLIESHHIDLIYTNTSTVLDGALAARRAGIPHIWHVHEYLTGNPNLQCYLPKSWVDFIISTLSDHIIVPSSGLAYDRFRNAAHKTAVIPNGLVFHPALNDDNLQLRSTLGLPDGTPVITFIGGLSRVKDPLTFIKAAKIIHDAHPDTNFLVIGSNDNPALSLQVSTLIKSSGLKDHCHLLGHRDDISRLLSLSTIHVSTSIRESFGRTLLEAMLSAKPVVATICGGPEEVVINGETGFIVEPQNPAAIATSVITLLDSPDLAHKFGRAGLQRANRDFTIEAYVERIEDIISEYT